MTLHIGFTGTRKGWTVHQWAWFPMILSGFPGAEFEHGDCQGSDAAAHVIAQNRRHRIHLRAAVGTKFRAFSKLSPTDVLHPPKPPLARNHDIVDATTILIATPAEMTEQLRSGTWSTVRYARKRGKRVIIVFPDGTVSDSATNG